MHVAEFFENVVLLQGAGTSANPVRERLEEMGHSPLSMDLADGVSWRKTLAQSPVSYTHLTLPTIYSV